MSLATLAQGHFGPRGIIYTTLLEVYKVMLHTKYKGSSPCGFRQEDFCMLLPIKAYVKPVTQRRGHFWPQGYNLNKLGRSLLHDTTYQKSRLWALWFQTRRFVHVAPYISLFKHVIPGDRPFFGPTAII